MKAIVYDQFREPLELRQVPEPRPAADGVVIRVHATGLCRSDWHGWMGHDSDIHVPHVPGHEFAGVIEEVGPEVRVWRAGDRVTVPFAVGCGRCPQCLSGNHQVCDDYFQPGFTAWGSFAEFVAIPHADANVVRLPESVGFVEAASLGCRFATSFRAIVHQGRVRPGDWVAVHGCGGVGLAAVMIATVMGAQVVAVDVRDEALQMACSLGAIHAVNARTTADVASAIRDLTHGGAQVSLDALGHRALCRNSILCLRKRGRHVQVGLLPPADREPPVPMSRIIAWELEILGSHGMAAQAYRPMLDLIVAGKLQPARLVRNTISLGETPAELVAMGDFRGTGVIVVDRF